MNDNVPVWGSVGRGERPLDLPRLTKTIDAGVCVIGLGGSGLACIMELQELGVAAGRIVGLDAGVVAGGAAGRNGGFLLAGTAEFYHDAITNFGHERARRLYQLTVEQIERMNQETPDAIRRTGSLRIASSSEEVIDCEEHFAALHADGFPAEKYTGAEGRGLLVSTDCAFNPLRRCRSLACRLSDAGVHLFEHSRAIEIRPGEVVTDAGRVRCEQVIVAVDGNLANVIPTLAPRTRPVRLQMLATSPTTDICLPRPVYARWGYDYWQQLEDGRLVLGGFRDAGGDAEWTADATPSESIQQMLESFLRDQLNVRAPITHRWAATVSYSTSGLPLLEEVQRGVVATGAYSGTGNVLGAICGRGAARLALGKRAEIVELLAA